MSSRKHFTRLGALSLAFYHSTAYAQVPPPPERPQVDRNGVDMTSGSFTMSRTDLTIGPAGPLGLQYSRYWSKNGWRTNYTGVISGRINNPIVSVFGFSLSFENKNCGDKGSCHTGNPSGPIIYTEKIKGGNSFVRNADGSFTLTDKDGVIYQFVPLAGAMVYPFAGNIGKISFVQFPSGARLVFNYEDASITGASGVIVYDSGMPQMFSRISRLASVTNSAGYKLAYTYELNGDVDYSDISRWALPRTVSASNDALGNCTLTQGTCNPTAAATVEYSYDHTANTSKVLSVRTPVGNILNYGYSGSRLTTEFDLAGHVRYASYYDGTELVSRAGHDGTGGEFYSYALTDTGYLYTVADSYTAVSDPAGRLVSITDGVRRSFAYSPAAGATHLVTKVDTYRHLDPVSYEVTASSEYEYDDRGNLTKRTRFQNPNFFTSSHGPIVELASYPAACSNVVTCNKPLSATDARGGVTDFTYDPVHGGVTSVTSPAAQVGGVRPQVRTNYAAVQAVYSQSSGAAPSPSGTPIYLPIEVSSCRTTASCIGTADETRITTAYGPQPGSTGTNLLPLTVTTASGDGSLSATETRTYDSLGNAVTVDGPLPGAADTSRAIYDASRRVIGTISPDPDGAGPMKNRAARTTYIGESLVSRTEAGVTDGQSSAAWAAFQTLEQVDITNRGGKPSRAVRSAGGVVVGVTDTAHVNGRLVCQTQRMNPENWLSEQDCYFPNAEGVFGPDRITGTGYDAFGRQTSRSFGVWYTNDYISETMTYNEATGQVETVSDGEGNKSTYEYDGFGRLLRLRYPTSGGGSSTTDYLGYTYDAAGNVVQERLRDGQTVASTYDLLNRKTFEDRSGAPSAPSISYTYDLQGRRLSADGAGGGSVAFGYDALGRLRSETTAAGGTMQSEFDIAGRRTRLTWGDGFFVTYDYLVTGAMTTIRENGAATLVSYGYDALGRRASRTLGNGTSTTYGYDSASRLTSLALTGAGADTIGFGYNPAGQIASRTNTNDAYSYADDVNLDRPMTTNSLNQYTTSGNVVPTYDARGNLTSAGSSTIAYNSRNQLTHLNGSPLYEYDAAGRLDRVYPAGLTWQWDGSRLVAERSGGSIVKRYVHGARIDEPVVEYVGSGTGQKRWLEADERGSIVRTTDASGGVLAINTYDEYGIPGAANSGRFQYTGQMWMPELGLYHYKARMYSPTLGRFLQTDPIGYGDGLNIYDYVAGDPVNRGDSTGTECVEIVNSKTGAHMGYMSFGDDICVGGRREERLDLGFDFGGFGLSPFSFQNGPGGSGGGGGGVAPQRGTLLRRAYRWFNPDPCSGKGTNEGVGVPAGIDPYKVDEGGSLGSLFGHVLPDHDFGGSFSDSRFLTGAILTTILTNPVRASGGSVRYTVNTGQFVGYDRANQANTDYLTVIMGPPSADGSRALRTAYPGCPKAR